MNHNLLQDRPWLRFADNEEGSSAVEFSIVGSVFIALCVAILQLGWTLQIRNQIGRAADAALRVAMVDSSVTAASLENSVESALATLDADYLTIDVGETTIDSTDFRTLDVSYVMATGIPLFPSGPLTIQVTRRMPIP